MWIYLAILIILFGSGYWMSYPLLKKRKFNFSLKETSEDLIHDLKTEKEQIYLAIKELEFDYKMGKLSEEDYRNLNEKYMLKAAKILKMDEQMEEKGKSLDKEIEKEIESEVLILRKKLEKKKNLFCNQCGREIFHEDRFC